MAARPFADVLGEFVADTTDATTSMTARDIAARAFVDTLGCAIAGSTSDIGGLVLRHVRDEVVWGAVTGTSAVFDGGTPAGLNQAVLANATLGHAVDFDDTNHPLYGHPSAVLVPTVLGVGAVTGVTGADLVTAYLVGHEVEIALARAINHDHYGQGFHATGTLGTFGAAAAAARLFGLDGAGVARALTLAASMSSGLRANIGSMTKPLHAGLAAMHGVQAARLASQGWESSPDAFERPATGYFAAYMKGGTPDPEAALAPLGKQWAIDEPYGQQIKPYPACGATHPSIEAACRIHKQLGGDVSRITAIRAGVCSLLPGILVYDRPVTGDQGRFSLTYTVARGLLEGRVGLEHFTAAAVTDPRLEPLMALVDTEVDDRVADSSEFGAILTVTTDTGQEFEERVDFAVGKNARPMTEEQLWDKVSGCLATVGEPSRELWKAWRSVDDQASAAVLWEALAVWWTDQRDRAALRAG
jgi:2-methylcitrate dehydratase PrpD